MKLGSWGLEIPLLSMLYYSSVVNPRVSHRIIYVAEGSFLHNFAEILRQANALVNNSALLLTINP